MAPTFFVATMYCGEPDFEHCVQMIRSQINVNVKHFIVANKPEIVAHNEVYQAFNEVDPTWIRAKIDADLVLTNFDIFERVSQDLQVRTHVLGLNPFVQDFMTDSEIKAGLSFYAPNTKFKLQTDPLKCDRNVLLGDETLIRDWHCVGKHMYYADERTAFRYGLHRGLKGQRNIKILLEAANQKHQDPIRKMALKGFDAARSSEFDAWHRGEITSPNNHNYSDETFRALFEQARRLTG